MVRGAPCRLLGKDGGAGRRGFCNGFFPDMRDKELYEKILGISPGHEEAAEAYLRLRIRVLQ